MTDLLGRTALVTGGGGFVGSHIAELLLEAGCAKVIAIDNFTRGRRENLANASRRREFVLVEGDIRDRALVASLVSEADVVFHQAALRVTQCAVEPRHALEVMIDATFDLVEMCAKQGIGKFIFASSASIYGMAETFPTPESQHPYADTTLYGMAKLSGEGMLRAFADMGGLPHVVLRYFNVYGPRMDVHGRYTEVLVRWMERIDAGLPPIIFGDGRQSMDMVDVRDIARANIAAALSPIEAGYFNVGSGSETSLLDLAAKLSQAMGQPQLAPEFQPARRVNAVEHRRSDISKIAGALGFRPEIELKAGLADLVAWWRANRGALAAGAERALS